MDNDLLLRGLLAGAAVVLLLVLVVLRRRRTAADEVAPESGAPAPEPAAPPQPTASEPVAVVEPAEPAPLEGAVVDRDGPDPVEVRSLRAQVRTLEQALERMNDVPAEVPAPRRPTHAAAGPDVAAPGGQRYRRQVTATLRGLAGRTGADEAPERTMSRVVAAIERLDSTGSVDRPVLPTVPAGTVLESPARPAELAAAAPVAAPVTAPAAAPAPAVEPESEPEPAPEPVPVAAGPRPPTADRPVVEPVRPVAPIGAGYRRTSRWSRRDHASGSRS